MFALAIDLSRMTQRREVSALAEIEQLIRTLLNALSAGRRPTHEEADRLRSDVERLAHADGAMSPWKLAELRADAQEIVRHALPLPPALIEVPAQRRAPGRVRRRSPSVTAVSSATLPVAGESRPTDLEAQFGALRTRADALHDAVEAGERPHRAVFEDLYDDMTTFRRCSDGPEIRQMLDDVRRLHRFVLRAGARWSVGGRATVPQRRSRSRGDAPFIPYRRRSTSSSPRRQGSSRPRKTKPEEEQLVQEARYLRERAEKFVAAESSGRTFPLRESQQLFLHFRIIRLRLDVDTQALNDTTVRRLSAAVDAARARLGHHEDGCPA